MPISKKEVSTSDTKDTAPISSEKSLDTNVEKTVKPAPRKRKPAQPKAAKAITEPEVTPAQHSASESVEAVVEVTEVAKAVEAVDSIEPIPTAVTTESLDPAVPTSVEPVVSTPELEADTVELEITPTEETKHPESEHKLSKKQKKKTHSKEKFYIRNDLLARIKTLTKANGKSFKTSFINDAIEKSLDELEAKE